MKRCGGGREGRRRKGRERGNKRKEKGFLGKKSSKQNQNILFSIEHLTVYDRDSHALKVPKVLVAQSCPTLCDPLDCSSPGSPGHGILQIRILESVAISFSRGSS